MLCSAVANNFDKLELMIFKLRYMITSIISENDSCQRAAAAATNNNNNILFVIFVQFKFFELTPVTRPGFALVL